MTFCSYDFVVVYIAYIFTSFVIIMLHILTFFLFIIKLINLLLIIFRLFATGCIHSGEIKIFKKATCARRGEPGKRLGCNPYLYSALL